MSLVLADVGVPMIGAYWPPAWVALLPIIGAEAWLARRILGIRWWPAIWSTSVVNAFSTLVGIPLTWMLLTVIQYSFFPYARPLTSVGDGVYAVTAQAAWLAPYEGQLVWMVPAAGFVLTIVFFLMSVAVEWPAMRLIHRGKHARAIRRWAWRANILSYCGLLTLVIAVYLIPGVWRFNMFFSPPCEFVMQKADRLGKWFMDAPVRRSKQ